MNPTTINEAVYQGLGTASTLFMSNPKPGTKQVMPDRELLAVGQRMVHEIMVVVDETISRHINNGAIKRDKLLTEIRKDFSKQTMK